MGVMELGVGASKARRCEAVSGLPLEGVGTGVVTLGENSKGHTISPSWLVLIDTEKRTKLPLWNGLVHL